MGPVNIQFRKKEFLSQFYFVANQSLLLILVCVSFAAVVTVLESSFHMKLVIQNDFMVPGFASMMILRELGVIVTALLVVSRVGAGYASEVGSMQVTEQIDALKMLGIGPVQYIVTPRVLACALGTCVLTILANTSCLISALLVSDFYLGYPPSVFLQSMRRFVAPQDFAFAMIKGFLFGLVIPLISCSYGFRCQPGAEGVGSSTTKAVVANSMTIIILDFILSYIFSHFY
ncbi:MAG: MlaE family ABC transporter permease [Pseudobdellovibrionaceae bacterium]